MEMPAVSNVAKDEKHNITFNVLAYREMTRAEVMQAIFFFRTTKQGRKLKKNTTYTIISQIGLRDAI